MGYYNGDSDGGKCNLNMIAGMIELLQINLIRQYTVKPLTSVLSHLIPKCSDRLQRLLRL